MFLWPPVFGRFNGLRLAEQFSPSENAENESFTKIVLDRLPGRYLQSYDAANAIGITGLALARIASSLMILTSDGQKTNLGLSLKFEAKGLKVMDYSRKEGRSWEFSDKAIDLIREYKVWKRSLIVLCLLTYTLVSVLGEISRVVQST